MRIGLLVCLLSCLSTSCQNHYSEELIEQHLNLNKQLECSNQIIKKHTSEIIKKAHKKIQRMPSHKDIYSKIKEITLLANTFYEDVEGIKRQLEDNFQEEEYPKTVESLVIKAQNYYQESMQVVVHSWSNEGIKGSVFADISYKKRILQRLNDEIGRPVFEQLNTNTSFNKKDKALPIVLTQLYTLQNDIRRQENALIGFFTGQIPSYGGYDLFDVYAFSQKSCIRLGETYEAGICFGSYAPISILNVNINKDSIPILYNKANYQIKPKELGEQAYKVTLTFQHLISQEIERREQLFYFEVQ